MRTVCKEIRMEYFHESLDATCDIANETIDLLLG